MATGWVEVTIIGTARHLQDATGLSHAERRRKVGDDILHYISSLGRFGNEVPSKCATFFWTSMIASARARRACNRAFSLRRASSSSASSSRGATLGPRRREVRLPSLPWSRSLRHLEMLEE